MEYTESIFAEQGERHYTLSEDTISISGKGLDVTLNLKGFEPDYRIVSRRSPAFYVGLIGMILAVVLGGTTAAGLDTTELVEHPMVLSVILAVISLLIISTSEEIIARAVFKSTMGPDAIEIAQRGPDVMKFDDFVGELSTRIRQAKSTS